jgi:hypothetical protein
VYEGAEPHRVHVRNSRKLKDHVFFLAELGEAILELRDGEVLEVAHHVAYDTVLGLVTFHPHVGSFVVTARQEVPSHR